MLINITKTILAFLLATFPLQVNGQLADDQITGSWQGVLNTGNMELRLVFNITLSEDGSFNATLDSPDQGAMGIPLGEVSLSRDSLRIEAPIVNGFYLGKISSETSCN